MRGTPDLQMSMLTTVSTEALIPANHPIRRIRKVVDAVLAELDDELEAMYAETGRPSVPPEALLKASVLMAMYSIRSERQFCERLNFDMLLRWFLDMDITAPAFERSTFSKNRKRLLDHEIADLFFAEVVEQAKLRRYVASEHFSVDGTLLEAWASHKSFRPKDGKGPKPPSGGGRNAEANFHGERRSNQTHESTTDPEAKLARKSFATAAKLSFAGHALMENRNALLVDVELTEANGYAEREAALTMLGRLPAMARRRTVGADKGYDTRDFVDGCRELGITPHVAMNEGSHRRSAIDARTERHAGYIASLRIRKRIEESFGWLKTIAGGRKLRYIGRARNRAWLLLAGAAYNVIRIAVLDATGA
jgi:transposase